MGPLKNFPKQFVKAVENLRKGTANWLNRTISQSSTSRETPRPQPTRGEWTGRKIGEHRITKKGATTTRPGQIATPIKSRGGPPQRPPPPIPRDQPPPPRGGEPPQRPPPPIPEPPPRPLSPPRRRGVPIQRPPPPKDQPPPRPQSPPRRRGVPIQRPPPPKDQPPPRPQYPHPSSAKPPSRPPPPTPEQIKEQFAQLWTDLQYSQKAQNIFAERIVWLHQTGLEVTKISRKNPQILNDPELKKDFKNSIIIRIDGITWECLHAKKTPDSPKTVSTVIGAGAIKRAKKMKDGKTVLAVVKKEAYSREERLQKIWNARAIYQNLGRLPGILRYFIIIWQNNAGVLSEKMTGDLFDIYHMDIPPLLMLILMSDATEGIANMHEYDYAHLDIKPGNIFANLKPEDREALQRATGYDELVEIIKHIKSRGYVADLDDAIDIRDVEEIHGSVITCTIDYVPAKYLSKIAAARKGEETYFSPEELKDMDTIACGRSLMQLLNYGAINVRAEHFSSEEEMIKFIVNDPSEKSIITFSNKFYQEYDPIADLIYEMISPEWDGARPSMREVTNRLQAMLQDPQVLEKVTKALIQ